MLDHHIQRAIVYRLAFADSLRFSEIKPNDLENKLFDYHLKKVLAEKLVEKDQDGSYKLTAEGRRLGERALDKQLSLADKAESVLFLAVRRSSDKAWLLYRRKTHPLLGKVGFMHATPVPGQTVSDTAAQVCLQSTGVKATFAPLGSGIFTTYNDGELESYTNFTFLVSNDAEGDIASTDELAEYFWAKEPDFTDQSMLPNMKTLGNLHKQNQVFFIEKQFDI